MKILQVIIKNLKLLTRSKGSALIVLLGPLILMLLISLSFNNSTLFNVKIGAYSDSYSELAESILSQLEDEQYKVVKVDSEEDCVDKVKTEGVQLCLLIPPSLQITSQEPITFYVDDSRINLVHLIINTISNKLSIKSEELSIDLTTKIVNVLNDANVKIAEESPNLPEVKSTLTLTESKLSELDSAISGLESTSSISSEISNIQLSLNVSSGEFSNLTSLVSALETKISQVKSSSEGVSSLVSQISKEKEKVERLNSALSSIIINIDSIEIKDIDKIVNPISSEVRPITTDSTHLGNAFPVLLMIVLMFTGIVLSASTVIDEKTSKAYLRNYISPTPSVFFLIGDYAFSLIIMLLQMAVIFIVTILATSAPFSYIELLNTLVALILISSVFILIGMFIGYVFRSSETANMASISVATVLLFFSSTVLPLETLPVTIREIVKYNPFVLGESLLRQTILFKESLQGSYIVMSAIILYISVLAVLTYLTRRLNKNI